jgi:hypothetical protein
MVHSNQSQGETIKFKYYDADIDKLYSCDETIIFKNDMVIADAFNSFAFHAKSLQTHISKLENIGEMKLKTYPNPFDRYLNIEYEISGTVHVNLSVFDMYGRKIMQLVNQVQQPDHYSIHWDSQLQSTGTYIILLQAGDKQEKQKVTFFK